MVNGRTVEQKSLKLTTRLQGEALTAYRDIPMDDRKSYEIVKAALQRALIPEKESSSLSIHFTRGHYFPVNQFKYMCMN